MVDSAILPQSKRVPLHCLVVIFSKSDKQSIEVACKFFDDYEIITRDSVCREYFNRSYDDDFRRDIFHELKHKIKNKLFFGERAVCAISYMNEKLRNELTQDARNFGVPIFYILDDSKLGDFNLARGDRIAHTIQKGDRLDIVSKFPLDSDQLFEKIKSKFNGITVIPDIHSNYESFFSAYTWATQWNHFIILLGDIIDYGPNPIECLELAYRIIVSGRGLNCLGNHEVKLLKWLYNQENPNMKLSAGNKTTTQIFKSLERPKKVKIENKFKTLANLSRHHIQIKNVIFAHAAIREEFWNNPKEKFENEELRSYAIYGQIDKEKPFKDNGFPNRKYDWVDNLETNQLAIVGHDIKSFDKPITIKSQKGGSAVFLDLGSGKGGQLCTADIKFLADPLKISHFNLF